MLCYIKTRYQFKTVGAYEVLSYSELPVESIDGSDIGAVFVDGKVDRHNINDWLILDNFIFRIDGVSFDHKTQQTKVSVADYLTNFDAIKIKISSGTTLISSDYDRLIANTFGTSSATFNDPVFSLPYVSISETLTHMDGLPWHWQSYGAGRVNQNAWYTELASDGLISLSDLFLRLRSWLTWAYMIDGIQNAQESDGYSFIPEISDNHITIKIDRNYYERSDFETTLWNTGVKVAFIGETELISEDYNESAQATAATFYYGNNRYNFAPYSQYSSSQTSGENPIPISSRLNYTHGQYVYGKFTSNLNEEDREIYVRNNVFNVPDFDYKIVFKSSERYHTNYILRLLMPDGEVFKARLSSSIKISSGDHRYIYTCGDYKTLVSERLKFRVNGGVLKL